MTSATHEGEKRHFAISAWAIKNPIPVAVLFIALILAGLISYMGLPIKQFPNVQFPLVVVTVTQNGAAPGELETQVTRPVEDALAGISNVHNITSSVVQGVSTTSVEFDMGVDLQRKLDDVRGRIDQARAVLPRDIDEPLVSRVDMDAAPIISYIVSAPQMSNVELSWFIDDTLSRALQTRKGVAQVQRTGGVNREINVLVDPDRLAARGLTAAQVNNALRTFNLDASGGRVAVGGREQTIRVLGSVETLNELRALTIPTGAGSFVQLTDVADIGDGAAEIRSFARLDGRPVAGFEVIKTREASDVAVDDAVIDELAKLEKKYPGVTFTRIFGTVDETRSSFHATVTVLLEGMFLAALVVFLFLRDWRATLITAFAMPVSLIPTFFVMQMFGFSLNLVTLLALTLVIGILVDDAIVEIENIEKRVALGQRPFDAAMVGADAIGLAVVATTAAIVVVFTPVSFMPGIPGQFFKEFGITVSVAVLFSLVVARLLTPLMAAYFLKANPRGHDPKPFEGRYRRVLEWALDHRIVTWAIGLLMFFGSVSLVFFLKTGFIPPGDPDYVYVKVQAPPGTTSQTMEGTVGQLSDLFKNDPAVRGIYATVGGGTSNAFSGSSSGSLQNAQLTILLKPKRSVTGEQFRAKYRARLAETPDARVAFLNADGGAGFNQVLTGDDPKALDAAAYELERQMRGLKVLADPRPSNPPVGPEIVIRPRAAEAARLGVSVDTIAQVARVATVGDIDANVAKLTDGERRIPIRVRLPADARADIDRIRSLRVPTARGGVTTLDSVADVEFQAGPAKINRLNRARQVTVEAELNGVELGQAVQAVNKLPIMKNLPPGVRPASIGDQQQMMEMMMGFVIAMFSGIGMIYGVLVLLFRSFFKPIIILSALPLAVGGAFLGLLVFGMSLSMPSLIGFLLLLGLAAKNSILLVEYAIERERDGMSQREALIEACRERARPIVMTTLAMAAGMLPTALGLEKGAEFRQPMAIAVIGGLMTSTILSLVLVPVVYEIVDDFEMWLKPKLARFITPREAKTGTPSSAH